MLLATNYAQNYAGIVGKTLLKIPDLNSMCTNTSIYLAMKMKFISSMVLKCSRIL